MNVKELKTDDLGAARVSFSPLSMSLTDSKKCELNYGPQLCSNDSTVETLSDTYTRADAGQDQFASALLFFCATPQKCINFSELCNCWWQA